MPDTPSAYTRVTIEIASLPSPEAPVSFSTEEACGWLLGDDGQRIAELTNIAVSYPQPFIAGNPFGLRLDSATTTRLYDAVESSLAGDSARRLLLFTARHVWTGPILTGNSAPSVIRIGPHGELHV